MVQQVPRRWNISLNLSEFESQLSTPWGFEKLFAGSKFCENGEKLRKSRNLIPAKFNTFKVKFSPKKWMQTYSIKWNYSNN